MNCALTTEQHRQLRRKIAGNLNKIVTGNKDFSMKDYMHSVYSLINNAAEKSDSTLSPEEKERINSLALDYARLVPGYVMQIVATDRGIQSYLRGKGLSLDALADLADKIEDDKTGIDAVKDFLGLVQDVVQEVRDANQTVAENVQEETPVETQDLDHITPVAYTMDVQGARETEILNDNDRKFRAIPPTITADRDQEALSWKKTLPDGTPNPEYNKPNPALAFYYNVKRSILAKVFEPSAEFDSSQINYHNAGPVYLTIKASKTIPKNQLRPGVDPESEAHQTGIVMVLTDKYGEPLYFNNDAEIDYSGGKMAYYLVRKVTEENFDKDGNVILKPEDHESAKALSRQTGISIEEATSTIALQLKFMKDLRDYINKDAEKNTVRAIINGGSLGHTDFDFTITTPINKINFGNESFSPFVARENNPAKGEQTGHTYFSVSGMGTTSIPIERPRVSQDMADKLASLMVDDIKIKDPTGKLTSISPIQRQKLVDSYYMTKGETLSLPVNEEDGTYTVKLYGKSMDLSNPAAAKEILTKFFTSLAPVRKVTNLTSFQKANIIKNTEPGYQSKYRLGAVLEQVNPGAKSTFWVIEYPKLNLSKDLLSSGAFQDVDLVPDADGNIVVTKTNKSYPAWIKDNFHINYALNNEGKLLKMNAYMTFAPLQEEVDKIYPKNTAVEEIKEAAPTPITEVSKGPADSKPGDLLNDVWSDPELQKNLDQKSKNKKATEDQIAAAKKWYESHPMSKHFPFETLFNAVNTKTPRGIASWAMHGITLYKGSDFTDLYHEAWHGFTQTFLTKAQKTDLYNEARKQSGSFTDFNGSRVQFSKASELQLEEWLAEDFRSYMLTGKFKNDTPVKKSLFRKILDFLKNLFGSLTFDELASGEKANQVIQDIYEKMRVGNLSEYSFSAENSNFNTLNKGIEKTDPEETQEALNYENSGMIVDTVDSLISEFIDKANAGLNDQEKLQFAAIEDKVRRKQIISPEERDMIKALKAKQTYKYTSTLVSSIKGKTLLYKYVQQRMAQIHNEFVDEFERTDNQVMKDSILKRIELMNWCIRNFGNLENITNNKPGKGVIGYHVKKSDFFSAEDKEAFFEGSELNEEDEAYKKGREGYDKGGNELSLKDLASREVLFLLRSLHAKDSQNEYILNNMGVPQLVPFDQVWNRLARMLQNTRSPQVMYNKIAAEVKTYPALQQLLDKLGPVTTIGSNEYTLWTNFWQTFNKTRIPLVQMTVESTTLDETGEVLTTPTYSIRIGESSAEYKKVGQRWESYFSTTNTNPYILTDEGGRNYLDVNSVLRDFPEREFKGREFEFFRAIGMLLDDKEEIRKAVKDGIGGATWIRKALKYIAERGDIPIYGLRDIVKAYDEVKIQGVKHPFKKDEKTRYNQLQELQARYSDEHSNFMVTNAEGNTQFEHSLNNSLTVIVNSINDAPSYQDLIAMPHMNYLDMKRNPFVKASTWMNSLFHLDLATTDPMYGKKRRQSDLPNSPAVKINITNLSGVALMKDGMMTPDGIASASADEFTKLIMDFHLTVDKGQPELMRHADKGTSFSISLSNVFTLGHNKTLYVDTLSFVKQSEGLSSGHIQAYNIVLPHISAELDRINIMKKMVADGVQDFDFKYLKRGQEFVTFDDVLSETTKNRLYTLKTPLVDYLESASEDARDLQAKIYEDVATYFRSKVDEANKLMGKAEFIADSLISKLQGEARNKMQVNRADLKQAAIESFVYNTWLHNLESLTVLYGDLAQYNMLKEEFHKRNAGMGSTGNIYRTDGDAISYVNSVLGRAYGKSLGIEPKAFDGTFDTAVTQDNSIPSEYYAKYAKHIEKDIRDRMAPVINKLKGKDKDRKIAEMESSIKAATEPYTKMDEGDAQGWIGFDSYRILLSLEGKWTKAQEKMYQDIVHGKSIRVDEILQFFPTQKVQYFGTLRTSGLPVTAFHKFSLFPLIPTVIKGTNLENLHNKMMNQGIDYALFQSGSKVGTLTKSGTPDKMYSDNKKRALSDEQFTKNTVHLEYLKDQLEIAPEFKGKVVFSTQMRKLIEDGLIEGGVATDFMPGSSLDSRIAKWSVLSEIEKAKVSKRYNMLKTYENNIAKLTEYKTKELLKEANWKMGPDGNPIGDLKDLMKFVSGELSRQDLSDHELDFIQVDKQGKLVNDLSMSLSADKIERLLNAIVVNRLIRQKVKGEGLIQVSGAGFERMEAYTNPEEKDLEKWGTNDLPTYDIGKDGSTKAMKVKIALQGQFIKLLQLDHKDGNKIYNLERLNEMLKDEEWLNSNDHRRMITMVGVRIPVQGLNSMEFMEVYEFLPTEAGNIIVPPAEIVAKSGSDFDIDKLTVMMPSYQSINGKPTIAKQRSKKEVEAIYEEVKKNKIALNGLRDTNGQIVRGTNDAEDKLMRAIFGSAWEQDYTEDEINDILKEEGLVSFEEFYEQLNGAKAIENDLIWNIKDILSLPENFVKLIRPNGTDIVRPLADDLSDSVMDFDPKKRVFSTSDTAKNKQVSGTRVLEMNYNMYKHSSNNIGKQTLGLGAVDNTYNALFNRVGAKMNPTAGITTEEYNKLSSKNPSSLSFGEKRKLNSYRRQTLLLPHNTLKAGDQDAISLSNLLDADGENVISDVISQLINGWVDIAKDAWIFNIQGNKEIAPSLLFMVQAGVPFKTAVYLSSQPLVREYVRQQKLAKSTFAGPLGKAPSNPVYFRNKAREEVMTNPAFGFALTQGQVRGRAANKNIYDETIALTSKVLGNGQFDQDRLLGNIRDYSKAVKAGVEPTYDDYQRAAFLHFIEIENMAKGVRDIKMRMNFDTKKSSTLFEAQDRMLMVELLREDNRIPETIIDDLIRNSPIGSFYIQPFQLVIWKDLFNLRNHPKLNQFLSNKFREGISDNVNSTYPNNPEKFANEFRNDLMSFIFQNSVRAFNLDTIKHYRGYEVSTATGVQDVKSLSIGAFVKDGIMYIDKSKLKEDFETGAYYGDGYKSRGLATTSSLAFETAKEYYKFVFERENLRSIMPYETVDGLKEFEQYKKINGDSIKQKADETLGHYTERQKGQLYEMFLKDKALDNTFNGWKLFRSNDSYADQFFRLFDEFPELQEKYSIMKSLSVSEAKGYTNLRLTDTMLDSDKINVLHENLQDLSNPTVKKVENAEDNARISDFFDRMSTVAFLQSGLNTKSSFSLVRIVPQDKFIALMKEPVKAYTDNLNPVILQEFYDKFLVENDVNKKTARVRYKNYSVNMTLSDSVRQASGKPVVKPAAEPLSELSPGTQTFALKGLTTAAATELAKNNPDTVFVYNGTMVPSGNATTLDYVFQGVPTGNKLGLPSRMKYAGGKVNEEISDENGPEGMRPKPAVKLKIDEAITALKEAQAAGKTIAFNRSGYGQYMIGADPLTNIVKDKAAAPATFLYLSQELFKNFGFINPNYNKTRTGRSVIQSVQPINDEMVQDFMKHCFI